MPSRGTIAGVAVDAGWHTLYAIPQAREWRIVVNAGVRRWGTPIDSTVRRRDIGEGTVAVEEVTESTDLPHVVRFTVALTHRSRAPPLLGSQRAHRVDS